MFEWTPRWKQDRSGEDVFLLPLQGRLGEFGFLLGNHPPQLN